MAAGKTVVKVRQGVSVKPKDEGLVVRAGITALALVALGIGLWAVATLAGGVMTAGGPLELASGWLQAVLN